MLGIKFKVPSALKYSADFIVEDIESILESLNLNYCKYFRTSLETNTQYANMVKHEGHCNIQYLKVYKHNRMH